MNKKLSKLTALILSLAMVFSLALPAWAVEDTDPPQWEEFGYSSLEELLTDCGLTEEEYYEWFAGPAVEQQEKYQAWLGAHPEEVAAFDLYTYFEEAYYYYDSPEEYMDAWDLSLKEFEEKMLLEWAAGQMYEEEWRKRFDEFVAAHPEEAAAFDPYAYFEKEYYYSPQEYMDEWDLTTEEFEREMLEYWVLDQLAAEEQDQEIAAFKAEYPEECAAFDPFAYFDFLGYTWCDDAWDYMECYNMTEEEFRQEMFQWWMWDFQRMVEDKEQFGGSATGINVMVNGQCVPFPDVRPEAVSGRTMVPLAAVMEHLGAQVDYDAASGSALVTLGELSFTHVIGTDTLTLADGSSVHMDAASYAKDGRTLVPVRFFGEVLGYDVSWDSNYNTAVLIDRQRLKDLIDGEFTLLNRVLYAASGAEELREGQAVELTLDLDLDATLFDTLNGDENISAKLTGAALYSEDAIQLKLSGDLSALADLLDYFTFTGMEEQARQELAGLTVELIYCPDPGALYLRSPALARLELLPLEDPEAWAAIPADSFPLPMEALTGTSSVGELALTDAGSRSPFWTWNDALADTETLLEYLGDSQFTRSGLSYTASFSSDDGENWWSGDTSSGSIQIAPSGEHSCTYTIALSGSDSYMALSLDLSGSSGKSDLEMSFHIKNTLKYTLNLRRRVAAASRAPLSLPPAGSSLEFPYGPLGSGDM